MQSHTWYEVCYYRPRLADLHRLTWCLTSIHNQVTPLPFFSFIKCKPKCLGGLPKWISNKLWIRVFSFQWLTVKTWPDHIRNIRLWGFHSQGPSTPCANVQFSAPVGKAHLFAACLGTVIKIVLYPTTHAPMPHPSANPKSWHGPPHSDPPPLCHIKQCPLLPKETKRSMWKRKKNIFDHCQLFKMYNLGYICPLGRLFAAKMIQAAYGGPFENPTPWNAVSDPVNALFHAPKWQEHQLAVPWAFIKRKECTSILPFSMQPPPPLPLCFPSSLFFLKCCISLSACLPLIHLFHIWWTVLINRHLNYIQSSWLSENFEKHNFFPHEWTHK